jgi:hypothetical protein
LIMIDAGFIKAPLEVAAALVIEQPKTPKSLFAKAKKMLGGDGAVRNNGAVKKKKRGHLRVSTVMAKESSGLYTLKVQVHEGRDLLACDPNGFSDPYVKVTAAGATGPAFAHLFARVRLPPRRCGSRRRASSATRKRRRASSRKTSTRSSTRRSPGPSTRRNTRRPRRPLRCARARGHTSF